MARTRLLVVLVTAIAAAAVISSAGAGTRLAPAHRIDLSSPQKIQGYLHSIGLSPRHVVIQRGQRNYAGPNCPGRGWTCTTRLRVLQVGNENKIECSAQICGPFTQSGSKNDFRCDEKLTDGGTTTALATQECTVIQTGDENKAFFKQVIDQKGSSDEDARQTARATQTGTKKNELHVDQLVLQDSNSGWTQTQEAHQRLDFEQIVTGSGDNQANVSQKQEQRADGGTVQSQNTGPSTIGDCASGFGSPFQPNECVDAGQLAVDGKNNNELSQQLDQSEKSGGAAIQQQGSLVDNNGTDGSVHQVVGVAGSSRNHAVVNKDQKAKGAPGSIQALHDPGSCCGVGSQLGGTHNIDDISLKAKQSASEGTLADEVILLSGQSNSLTGRCMISEEAKQDGGTGGGNFAFEPCPPVAVVTFCATGGGGEAPTAGGCSDPVVVPDPCGEFSCGGDFLAGALAYRRGA